MSKSEATASKKNSLKDEEETLKRTTHKQNTNLFIVTPDGGIENNYIYTVVKGKVKEDVLSEYVVKDESGDEHRPVFEITVAVQI